MDEKVLQAIESLNQKIDKTTEETNRKIDVLASQVNENTLILKALEYAGQVNKAEHDKMAFDIAEIKGSVKLIQRDLSTLQVVTADNWSDIAKLKSVR